MLLASSRVWCGIEWEIGVGGRAFVSSPRCCCCWLERKQARRGKQREGSSSGESKATRAEVLQGGATINSEARKRYRRWYRSKCAMTVYLKGIR